MKRSFCLALVVVFVLSVSAFAVVRTFSRMRLDVPTGWNATESEDGTTVELVNDNDSSQAMLFFVGREGSKSLREWANEYYSNYAGYDFQQLSSGSYGFYATGSSRIRYTFLLDDSSTSSIVPEGYYLIIQVSQYVSRDTLSSITSGFTITVTPITNGGGTGGGEAAGSSGGGYDSGFGIFALGLVCLLFRKK